MSEILSLAKAYESYFKIGAAFSPNSLEIHKDLLRTQFNSFTCENQMKYEPAEPLPGEFHFAPADSIANLARELGIKMRAHAPVWHTQTPDWMYQDGEQDADPELIYQRIDEHTKMMAARYNDVVYCWDVVNEATRDDAPAEGSGESDVYRNSRYFQLCGSEFITRAFKSMDKYSPDAQLFYNDYNECFPEKRERIVKLIRKLQEDGCRVDGFGMQQHYFFAPNYDELKRSIETYAGLGLRLHVTELDVSLMAVLNPTGDRIRPGDAAYDAYLKAALNPTPEQINAISEIYEKLFEIYRQYKDVIDCVTTWGVADDITWLDRFGTDPNAPKIKQYPLLFDMNHQPKPCVAQMIDAVK